MKPGWHGRPARGRGGRARAGAARVVASWRPIHSPLPSCAQDPADAQQHGSSSQHTSSAPAPGTSVSKSARKRRRRDAAALAAQAAAPQSHPPAAGEAAAATGSSGADGAADSQWSAGRPGQQDLEQQQEQRGREQSSPAQPRGKQHRDVAKLQANLGHQIRMRAARKDWSGAWHVAAAGQQRHTASPGSPPPPGRARGGGAWGGRPHRSVRGGRPADLGMHGRVTRAGVQRLYEQYLEQARGQAAGAGASQRLPAHLLPRATVAHDYLVALKQ